MKEKIPWGGRGEWYVVIQVILFSLIFLVPLVGPQLAEWPDPWALVARVLGVILGLVGMLVSLAGVLNLGRNLTAVPHPKDNAHFVEGGAYRFVRHPIYCGIVFAAFGWGFFTNNFLALLLAIVLFLFFDIKTRREERWLSAKFAEYSSYQARVRKLIPYMY